MLLSHSAEINILGSIFQLNFRLHYEFQLCTIADKVVKWHLVIQSWSYS